MICQALEDFTLRILVVASIASIVIETSTASDNHRSIAWVEGTKKTSPQYYSAGFAILVAVVVVANVTAVNDYQKERQF